MKKILVAVMIIVILLVALVLSRNMLIKAVVVNGVKSVTGLVVKMGKVNVGFPQTTAAINDLKIYNPKDFNGELMADVPEIYIDYDLWAFFKNKVHIEELRINIKELNIVRKGVDKVNLGSLAILLPLSKSGKKPPELKIDRLALKIGMIIYEDYSLDAKPKRIELKVNIDETFENVSDPTKLFGSVTNKLFFRFGLGDAVSQVKQQGQAVVSGAVGKAGEVLQGVIDVAQDTVKGVFEPSN